jgi:hypothetical protein
MNERQKLVLLAGFGVYFAMIVYCPWKVWVDGPSFSPPNTPCMLIFPDAYQKTVYDWRWESLHRDHAGESYAERDRDRLRSQIIGWAVGLMLVFLSVRTPTEPPITAEQWIPECQ